MKRLTLIVSFVLYLATFCGVPSYVFLKAAMDAPKMSAFYALMNLIASVTLVAVTAFYVLTTKRYVDLFAQDIATRQSTQEKWERRRFEANRLLAVGDGFIELFFASKRELEVLLAHWDGLQQSFAVNQRAAIAAAVGSGAVAPEFQSRINNLLESALIRYSERAKDYNWRGHVLLHQVSSFVSVEESNRLAELYQILSRDFETVDDLRALLADYDRLLPEVSKLVQSIHTLALSRVAKDHL